MQTPRAAMRNIKECLRLKRDGDLSHERIALALGLSKALEHADHRKRRRPYRHRSGRHALALHGAQ